MKIRKSLTSSLICLIIIIITGVFAFADTIRLKDGSVLKGKVVSYSQGKFTIVVYIGGSSSRHTIAIEEIESVEFDSSEAVASSRNTNTGSSGLVPIDQNISRNEPAEPLRSTESKSNSRAAKEPPSSSNGNDLPPSDADRTASAIAEKTVSVAAAADWTSTEIRVQRGQRIAISASGEVELGDNKRCGPEGISAPDNRKLIPNRPTGALIAVIGDDNDDFIYVGGTGEFVSPHNGVLFLSVNEGTLKDNKGTFVARVRVLSNK